MSSIATAMVVTTAVGVSEGNKNRRAGAKAQASADALGREQLALSRDEFDYKQNLVNNLRYDASLTEADYSQNLGAVSAGVRDAFSKADDINDRNQSRLGVNPGSGRNASSDRKLMIDRAVAEANAVNTTRQGLRTEERAGVASANMAGLGISNRTVDVLGEQSSRNAANAASYNAAASNSLTSAAGAVGEFSGYYANRNKSPSAPSPVSAPVTSSGGSNYSFNSSELNLGITGRT